MIHVREIELGFYEDSKTILWVDNDRERAKLQMEKVMSTNKDIRIVYKPSSSTALSYLNSVFGFEMRKNKKYFRIYSNMVRTTPISGVFLMKFLQETGFHNNKRMIMDSEAKENLEKKLTEGKVDLGGNMIIT